MHVALCLSTYRSVKSINENDQSNDKLNKAVHKGKKVIKTLQIALCLSTYRSVKSINENDESSDKLNEDVHKGKKIIKLFDARAKIVLSINWWWALTAHILAIYSPLLTECSMSISGFKFEGFSARQGPAYLS